MQIAIDGPSGAGKSTIAIKLSKILNIDYLDTGSMYRAIALNFKNRNFSDYENDELLKKYLKDISINIENGHIFLNDEDVTEDIRKEDIGMLASKISSYKIVREFLVNLQRKIASDKDIIMDGRDVGTVILPNAEYKIFLTATLDERAKRRCNQLEDKGISSNYEEVKKALEKRDYDDMNREFSPLKKADDAVVVDCTDNTVEETIEEILNIIK